MSALPIPIQMPMKRQRPAKMPALLTGISEHEFNNAYYDAIELTRNLGCPAEAGYELADSAVLTSMTTSPYDPTRGDFRTFLLVLTTNEVNHWRQNRWAKMPVDVRCKHKVDEQERVGQRAQSPEALAVAAEEGDDRALIVRRRLAKLREAVAKHPVALSIIDLYADGDVDLKPAQIARVLDVGIDQVRSAQNVLRYHVRSILLKEGAN